MSGKASGASRFELDIHNTPEVLKFAEGLESLGFRPTSAKLTAAWVILNSPEGLTYREIIAKARAYEPSVSRQVVSRVFAAMKALGMVRNQPHYVLTV
jgi:Fe2+ or Zn2+ uptake regulation protein